jgi:hypothetical protein
MMRAVGLVFIAFINLDVGSRHMWDRRPWFCNCVVMIIGLFGRVVGRRADRVDLRRHGATVKSQNARQHKMMRIHETLSDSGLIHLYLPAVIQLGHAPPTAETAWYCILT